MSKGEMPLGKGKGRLVFWAFLALFSVALFVWLILYLRKGEKVYPYETAKVTRGEITVTVTADGNLRAKDQVEVGTEISGTVREVKVDFNQRVRKGQVLARLDTQKIEAELESARAALKGAQAKLEQVKGEYEQALRKLRQLKEAYEMSGGKTPSLSEVQEQEALVSRLSSQLLAAEAEVEVARATVKIKETELQKASIRSPIDGIVLSRNVEEGQTVVASLQSPTLFVIARDLREMELWLNVDEADIAKVKPGQRVIFTVDAYPDRKFEGVLKEVHIYPKTTQGVVTYEAVVSVKNPELLLKPAMTAVAEIEVQKVKDALLVPNRALRFRPPEPKRVSQAPGGLSRLFLPPRPPLRQPEAPEGVRPGIGVIWTLKDGRLEPIRVRVGPSDGQMTQVFSEELRPGMEVVVGLKGKGR